MSRIRETIAEHWVISSALAAALTTAALSTPDTGEGHLQVRNYQDDAGEYQSPLAIDMPCDITGGTYGCGAEIAPQAQATLSKIKSVVGFGTERQLDIAPDTTVALPATEAQIAASIKAVKAIAAESALACPDELPQYQVPLEAGNESSALCLDAKSARVTDVGVVVVAIMPPKDPERPLIDIAAILDNPSTKDKCAPLIGVLTRFYQYNLDKTKQLPINYHPNVQLVGDSSKPGAGQCDTYTPTGNAGAIKSPNSVKP